MILFVIFDETIFINFLLYIIHITYYFIDKTENGSWTKNVVWQIRILFLIIKNTIDKKDG